MSLYETIIEAYPELTVADFEPEGCIKLRDDSDGVGAYIESWSYLKAIPKGLKLGK